MSDFSWLSFHLPDKFIDEYRDVKPNFGFPIGGGNSLSELVYITKYSRKKNEALGYTEEDPDYGSKERWFETCRRCIEGFYSILKDHCVSHRTAWNENKAQKSAQDAYVRMFEFKWTPPGRGLANIGTRMVNEEQNSATLQSCGFVSTAKLSSHSIKEATLPFERIMEWSMNGIGVGFDVLGAAKLVIHEPKGEPLVHVIEDTREAWATSLSMLLESYFFENRQPVEFDYSQIRPQGAPLKRFGGTASGPGPLMELHQTIQQLFAGRTGERITVSDIADIGNLAGKAAVAGGARRSAEIILGSDAEEFINLKNSSVYPERNGIVSHDDEGNPQYSEDGGWGHLSNNSVMAEVGNDYAHLADLIATNGEPGLFYLDIARGYGRLEDPRTNRDHRVAGVNPCSEQSLEDLEVCTLVETFPFHHRDFADYRETLKAAYLYGKAVTLLATPWADTNAVMQRNHRIGLSMSGVVQFVEDLGIHELRKWCDDGYSFICHRDEMYSEWLGVRESIKKTSVKPSGTTSLVTAATPGLHWPEFVVYWRRMRFLRSDPMVTILKDAGYSVEPDVMDPKNTVVAEFPTHGPDVRNHEQVSVWEKAHLQALLQRYWADNQVSATLTFRPDEKEQIAPIIANFDGQLKSVSFLPITEKGSYAQMPYEAITENEYAEAVKDKKKIAFDKIYDNVSAFEAEGERFCSNDTCELPR